MKYVLAISDEAIIAIILAILACVLPFEVHEVSGNGDAKECFFVDYGALAFGAATVIAGLVAIRSGVRGNDGLSCTLAGLALLVGLWRLSYGAGLMFSPCG